MTVITTRASALTIGALVLAALAAAAPAAANPATGSSHLSRLTERVDVSSSGRQANAESDTPAIDITGRYVAFSSAATNLVAGDTNGVTDVFVRDRERGSTRRVSITSGGGQGDAESGFGVAISGNGRVVAFLSNAHNLAGQPAGAEDRTNVFVHDLRRDATEQVNVKTDGEPADYSASWPVAISATGRYVAFVSAASDLAPGDSDGEQVYVRDRQRRTTTRVSLTAEGEPFPTGVSGFDVSLSANGRYVAFTAEEGVFVRDRRRGVTERIATGAQPDLSANGRFVAFQSCSPGVVAGDHNDQCDVFLRDRRRGTTRLVSVDSDGQQSNGGSFVPSISPEGRHVAFTSRATNLVRGDTNAGDDVFVRDTRRGATLRVSVGYQGQASGGDLEPRSFGGQLSAGGRYVAYRSDASNLVPGDTNGVTDSFVTRVRAHHGLLHP